MACSTTIHASGFELAVDEINARGGVLGRPMEVVLGDSRTEPRIVVEQANRLIRQERVDFLAGTFSSAERQAGAPVATQANKILLYPTFYEGQEGEYFPGVCNKNIFMFGPEPTQQVWPFMEYMMNKFGKKFFMIGSALRALRMIAGAPKVATAPAVTATPLRAVRRVTARVFLGLRDVMLWSSHLCGLLQ